MNPIPVMSSNMEKYRETFMLFSPRSADFKPVDPGSGGATATPRTARDLQPLDSIDSICSTLEPTFCQQSDTFLRYFLGSTGG